MRNGSKQRDYIEQYLSGVYTHPTAREVYEAVREEFPHVSLGTVYRNLEYLVEHNKIKKLQNAGGEDRYDRVRERHNHAVCVKCGKVFDFIYPLDARALQAAIGNESDFRLSDPDFSVMGVCGECAAGERDGRI